MMIIVISNVSVISNVTRTKQLYNLQSCALKQRRAALYDSAELRPTTKQSFALRVGRASLYEWAELRCGIPAELRSANSPETTQSFMLNANPAGFES